MTRLELLGGFVRMGLTSFGGVQPWAYRILVEQRRWLSSTEFASLMSLGQMLPGPNAVNLSIMVGARFHGGVGALLACAGLVLPPLCLMLLVASVFAAYGDTPPVRRFLLGTVAAVAGLIMATACKMLLGQQRSWLAALVAGLAFVGYGVLRYPLPAVVAVLGPISILLAWKAKR